MRVEHEGRRDVNCIIFAGLKSMREERSPVVNVTRKRNEIDTRNMSIPCQLV